VTGTVTYKGKAVNGAMVTFQLGEGKENAIGTTDSNGQYELSMFQPKDGAIPGQYRVAVSKLPPTEVASTPSTPPPGQLASGDLSESYAPPTQSSSASKSKAKSEIPDLYANDQASGLLATVSAAGPNKFDFELK